MAVEVIFVGAASASFAESFRKVSHDASTRAVLGCLPGDRVGNARRRVGDNEPGPGYASK